jgi:muramoyltetrapeptide carboxypeptidase LdcA involved in peptidoglycan recycling
VPVEYPTTRVLRSSVADRARDLHAAFADPSIKAVMATIGGSDQTSPPPLMRTCSGLIQSRSLAVAITQNFLAFLGEAGVPGYYGGSVMVHLGRHSSLHPLSTAPLRAALFTGGPYEFTPASRFTDLDGNWTGPLGIFHRG